MPSVVWAVLQWTIGILTLIGLIIAAIKGLPPAWRVIYQFFITMNALAELPKELAEQRNFRTETASTLETHTSSLAAQDKKIDEIHHETHNNDGSSIKDSADRTEEAVERIELGVKGLYGEVDQLKAADEDIRNQLKQQSKEEGESK